MVELTALWLPILVASSVVFAASAFLHMALSFHDADYVRLPDEDAVLRVLRDTEVKPGAYAFPRPVGRQEMSAPETMEKYDRGPVGMMHVVPNGSPLKPKHLVQWLVMCLVASSFAAYVASRSLPAGAEYLAVFQIVGSVTLIAYCFGEVSSSIWKGQPWANAVRSVIDGTVYALLTAGVFGWLWPS